MIFYNFHLYDLYDDLSNPWLLYLNKNVCKQLVGQEGRVVQAILKLNKMVYSNNFFNGYVVVLTLPFIFKGDSLLGPDSTFFVILVGKVAVNACDASEAVLVLVLAYYIFNITYHPKLHSTLEFFQRYV